LADILPANGMSSMWTSKLGNKYPREQIDKLDNEHHRVLQQLRKKPANAICADCGENETTWASVSLGVFVCVHCADVHRAVGTHISKIKGCSGTYLWGPDEISRMQQLGNAAVRAQLGRINDECRPEKSATKEERVALCRKKYEDRSFNVEDSREGPSSSAIVEDSRRRSDIPVVVSNLAATSVSACSAGASAPSQWLAKTAPEPSLFDELFKDFDAEQHDSCFAGGPSTSVLLDQSFAIITQPTSTKSAQRSTTPDASTTASEDDFSCFLDQCLSSDPLALPERHVANVGGCQVRSLERAADIAQIWEDFGSW